MHIDITQYIGWAPLAIKMPHYKYLTKTLVFLILLFLLISCSTASAIPLQTNYFSSSISCPNGWSLWSPQLEINNNDITDADLVWCVKPQTFQVAPIEVDEVCKQIFELNPPLGGGGVFTGIIPRAISIHSDLQNSWLHETLDPIFKRLGGMIALGGVAGFGEITWRDGSKDNNNNNNAVNIPYTHFAPMLDWQSHSGCIAMQPDGFWSLINCKTPQRLFVCAFTLNISSSNNTTGDSTDSNKNIGSDVGNETIDTTEAPNNGNNTNEMQQPTHPPVLYPLPECLSGWTSYKDKCYRLFTGSAEMSDEGMSQQSAKQFCEAIHPHITLTAVLNSEENKFLSQLLQNWAQDRADDISQIRVFLGGIFTARGSVGVWYEDSLWYNDSSFEHSFPSSPSWPTLENHFYSYWAIGEPSRSFGCLTLTFNETWRAEDCRTTLPFICAYLNDGSVEIETSTTNPPGGSGSSSDEENKTTTTTTSAPSPSEILCMDDWTYFAPTNRCYHIFSDRSVAAADLEQRCNEVFSDIVPFNTIHAAVVTSVEESAFIGHLVSKSNILRVLVGVSYIERGAEGLYLDGITEWVPFIAESLWGVGQPSRESGCVVIDNSGAWFYFPCGTPAKGYVCVYTAGAVPLPVSTSTPTEIPTNIPTNITTTSAPTNETWPLNTRIASLSGFIHLVVAKGTVGIYSVETTSGESTDGLLLMFAPDITEYMVNSGWDESFTTISLCGSYKKQEYIFPIMQGVVTISYPNETMSGRVCISNDGVHYVPSSNITFEVVDVALHGFIPLLNSKKESNNEKKNQNSSSGSDSNVGSINNNNNVDLVYREIGIRLRSSGTLKLIFNHSLLDTTAHIHHLRFSSTADCSSGKYTFLNKDLSIIKNSNHHFFITYQIAEVIPVNITSLDRLHDFNSSEEQPPTEFFVCVAASKNMNYLQSSINNNSLDNNTSGNSSNSGNTSILSYDYITNSNEKNDRISSSLNFIDSELTWLYTLVPNMRVYITPPHVVVRGMWALPPATLNTSIVSNVFLKKGSSKILKVSQFSSPIIIFESEGLKEGMTLLLSPKGSKCQREYLTPTNDPTNPEITTKLDTMLSISTLKYNSMIYNNGSEFLRIAFIQLNLNHTGMWGTNITEEEQSWQICFAYTPFLNFIPLKGFEIIVQRARISAITTQKENINRDSPELKVSVGFSGILKLWGLNVDMWSPSQLSNVEIAFAESPPGSGSILDPTFQCSNSSLFYRQRSLSIVVPHSTDTAASRNLRFKENYKNWMNETKLQHDAVVVIPPGFLEKETTRRMRICLSVPLPFYSNNRIFNPTTATLDVRPIEILFIGPYAANFLNSTNKSNITIVEVAENSKDLVLPISGYGLNDDMLLFLSEERCYPWLDETIQQNEDVSYVKRVSRMNFTIMRPYDIPPNYQLKDISHSITSPNDVFITLNETHTSPSVADRIFGKDRKPLFFCLYAPGTRRVIYPLDFKFVVRRPYVTSIRIAHQTSSLFSQSNSENTSNIDVIYASFVDLVVEGFGLHDSETAFIPALDCKNVTSFLWRTPVRTSGVPSMIVNDKSSSFSLSSVSRYVNSQTSMSSWFISLTQAHTTRIGTVEPVNNRIDRFQWCVRYRDIDTSEKNELNVERETDNWSKGFVSTGISYHLIIPPTNGFLFGSNIVKRITRKTRHATLGSWEILQLVGPLIDYTYTLGNPLFIFFAEELVPCEKIKDYLITTNSSDRFINAVNGSAVILPKLFTNTGTFKLCASAIYPEKKLQEERMESTLQFFELKDIRIDLVDPVYAVFSLNRTDYVTVEQGQEWTLPISGSSISNMTLVRFKPVSANCSIPMPNDLDDVIVRNVFEGLNLFGYDTIINETYNSSNWESKSHYLVLERDLIRGLSIQEYKLCFKPDRSTPWMSSGVVLNVTKHIRRPTQYTYFADDGSEDVVSLIALPPTKIALEWLTKEKDTVNIVGAVSREVAVALWCRGNKTINNSSNNNNNNNNNNNKDIIPCGSYKRVMFVRPLDDDRDPCFVDFEAIESDIIKGPYVIDDGILTIPRTVTRNVSFYPNITQPWIMCLETAPERWREPISPLIQIQFTTPVPIGFRRHPDDSSNSTASFFGLSDKINFSEDRTEAEGNSTLVLHIEEASRVFYLNGYAIQRGFKIRFGLHCDEEVISTNSNENYTWRQLVAEMQELSNTILYEEPLTIEDDHGAFLLPATHFSLLEAPTIMCLSTNGGISYMKTNLSLTVLPSRLRRDIPVDETKITELVFRHTLVVPRFSKGTVSIADMQAENNNNNNNNNNKFSKGVQVLLSSVCHENHEGLPIIVLAEPNILTLTEAHTYNASNNRLEICIRTSTNNNNNELKDDTTIIQGFRSSGLFFRVLDIAVTSVSIHQSIQNDIAEENGLHHLIIRRGNESIMLVVTMKSSINSNKKSKFSNLNNFQNIEERYINMLDFPGALTLFRLAKFRIGRPCFMPDEEEPEAIVTSLVPLIAIFTNDSINVISQDGFNVENFMVPLHTAKSETIEPWSPSSLCFSVDGGRHYMSVGISYISVSWAPTLRVRFSVEEEEEENIKNNKSNENSGDDKNNTDHSVLSNVVHLFEQSSLYGRLVDIRYESPPLSLYDTPLNRYVSSFTADALWSGFLQDAGFVSGGELYLPALMMENNNNTSNSDDVALYFSVNHHYRNIPTGLTMRVIPMNLPCIGEIPTTFQQIYRQSNGWLLPIASACGRSVQAGTIIRVVDASVKSCEISEIEHNFVFDTFIIKSYEWTSNGVSPGTALQIPTSLPYIPDGKYKLCLKKDLPYHMGRASIFLQTSIEIEVTSLLLVNEVAKLGKGILSVFQGSETIINLQGSVVPFLEDIRIALIPTLFSDIQNSTIRCKDFQWLSRNDNVNETLPILWKRIKDFTLRLSPEDLHFISKYTVYHICFSVDGGLSFYSAGSESPMLQLMILPPTILGVTTTTADQYLYNYKTTTANVLRLERFFNYTTNYSSSSSRPPISNISPVKVSYFTDRPPSYYYNSSNCFIGNGFGPGSGRNTVDSMKLLAVAILRTDLFGDVCNGSNLTEMITVSQNSHNDKNIPKSLAMPVFLLDARSGCLLDNLTEINNISNTNNTGLLRKEWLNYTISLRKAGGLTSQAFLRGVTTRDEQIRRESTSYLFCTSLDGIHFYSANAPSRDRNLSETSLFSSLKFATPHESVTPLKNVSRLPLIIRLDPNNNGSFYTRDLAVVHYLVIRPLISTTQEYFDIERSADALVRFQTAVAQLLGVDPVIIVVHLKNRGVVIPAQEENASNSTGYPTYTLSLSLMTDARISLINKIKPVPELLLEYVALLHDNVTQSSLLSTLLPPNIREAGIARVLAPYVNFTFATGIDLHIAIQNYKSKLPQSPAEEVAWRTRFAAIPHATLVAENVPDDATNDSTYKATWWVVPLLFIFPVCLVMGSIFVYRRYLRFRPIEQRKAAEQRR